MVTTITLKSAQAAYQSNSFGVNTNTRLNWASPCTEEIVNEMLTTIKRMDIKGTEV